MRGELRKRLVVNRVGCLGLCSLSCDPGPFVSSAQNSQSVTRAEPTLVILHSKTRAAFSIPQFVGMDGSGI